MSFSSHQYNKCTTSYSYIWLDEGMLSVSNLPGQIQTTRENGAIRNQVCDAEVQVDGDEEREEEDDQGSQEEEEENGHDTTTVSVGVPGAIASGTACFWNCWQQ